jgi:hypothetical protein
LSIFTFMWLETLDNVLRVYNIDYS